MIMKPFNFLLLILLIPPILSSCAMQATQAKPIMKNDPLIDQIIATKTHAKIDFETLIKAISTYDVIYLSEKHDNPIHHQIQQRVIHALIKRKLYPTIGFEFFAMEDTPDLLNFIDSGKVHHPKQIEKAIELDLRQKLGWDTQPDEMWRYYFDLLKLARDERLQVAGIDLPSTLKRRLTRKGIEGLSPIEREQIFSTHLSNDTYKKYMFSIFKSAHCGMAQSNMQAKLYTTWTARNDKMALSITRLNQYRKGKGPVVVIIGKGHTEYGLGVIDRVEAIDKTIKQVNIDLTEVTIKPSSLGQYLLPLELKGFEKAPPADYLWLTPRVSNADPCQEFHEMLKKMKKHHPK
jgi:uncharacterized iron-regulated protein